MENKNEQPKRVSPPQSTRNVLVLTADEQEAMHAAKLQKERKFDGKTFILQAVALKGDREKLANLNSVIQIRRKMGKQIRIEKKEYLTAVYER